MKLRMNGAPEICGLVMGGPPAKSSHLRFVVPFFFPNLRDCLLHRNALGEVSGLVYVAASADGYVVGEELEGDYFEDGEE